MHYSIVKKSDLDKIVSRLDAEYYQPFFLTLEKKIKEQKTKTIRKDDGIFDCSAFYPSIVGAYNFSGKGIPFLRVNEIKNGLLSITKDTAFLPKEILKANPSTIAKCCPGDIIIAKGGNSLAKVALLTGNYPYYAVSRDVIILKTENLKEFNKFFIWIFLYSQIGQNLLLRTASQTGQPHLTLEALYQLDLPLYSNIFQNKFEKLYIASENLKYRADSIYKEAQDELLQYLKLDEWNSNHKLTFIKNLSDTISSSRIDAEYYQPKYDEFLKILSNHSEGCINLGEIIKDSNFKPQEDKKYIYIELSNIAENGEIIDYTHDEGRNLPSRARRKVDKGDLIVSTIEGSLSCIALIEDYFDNALCSNGFFVIKSNEINSETLLILLRSIVGQIQLKKGSSGTALTSINESEYSKIVLPKINPEMQSTLKGKINECISLRNQSKNLLQNAKSALEKAVYENEMSALNWMSKKFN